MVDEDLLKVDIGEEVEKAAKTLEIIGLSSYESRAYMALVAHGYGTADTIAQTARIPRTSCYRALECLEERGLAYSAEGRPRVYTPESPENVRKMVQARLDDTFDKLEMVYQVLTDIGMPQLVYTVTGKARVLNKLGELIETTSKRVILSTPSLAEIRRELKKPFESALKRGVEVVVITAPGQKAPPGVTVVRRKGLIATDVVSDGTKALLASPDLNACGYTDNPALAEHLERFLEILMEHTK
ncbi:MAG: helix-turn-helix domain-containing protein [Candidatus Thermoplasmatota archaeon]|nr:helix-turn-helix domain-containing protein [Candidatus Thermoplasmatota archaeon]